jgi:hypothetical protein
VEALTIEALSPSHPLAEAALLTFMEEMASRWYGRPVTEAEVREGFREFPSGELEPPAGLFLVAHRDGVAEGCAGLRLAGDGLGEVKPFGDNPYAGHWFAKRWDEAARRCSNVTRWRTRRRRSDVVRK